MEEVVRHNCGFCVAHTLHDAYAFIRSLQHRGREAAGIAAVGEGRIDVIKWAGGVDRFDVTDLHKIFPSPSYHTYMAHVRYATRGRKDSILSDAHPHTLGGQVEERGNHILIRDCEMAAVHNGQVDLSHMDDLDLSRMQSSCDTEALLYLYRRDGEHNFLRTIPGAYTMAIADYRKRDVIVLRDRTGIKPGVLGWKDGKYGVA
jgi:glutamine phosphoribosylpyrophosphate amidotransferase